MLKRLFFAFFLLAGSVAATSAQAKPEQALNEARDQFFDIKKRSIELERAKREAGKFSISENLTIKFPEIKNDFEEIQKLNDEIFQLTASETLPQNSAVHKSAAAIMRRAVRLQSNLFPTEQKPKKESPEKITNQETRDAKTLLKILDESINSFVHNAMFQNINLINPADALKAQKDLETVISASGALKAKTKD